MILLIMATWVCACAWLPATEQNPVESNQRKAEGQQNAEELLNKSKYSFQDLLDGNPGAVADAKEIFALTSDPKIKLRGASILLSLGKADQAQFDFLTGEAEKMLNYAKEMPWPTFYDKEGKAIDKGNPGF